MRSEGHGHKSNAQCQGQPPGHLPIEHKETNAFLHLRHNQAVIAKNRSCIPRRCICDDVNPKTCQRLRHSEVAFIFASKLSYLRMARLPTRSAIDSLTWTNLRTMLEPRRVLAMDPRGREHSPWLMVAIVWSQSPPSSLRALH